MIELGNTGGGAAAAGDLIKDSSEASFMNDVIEGSKETPVIVDFWAPWCGPCKTLGPALEAAVTKAGGKVKMVKVNVDEAQNLAQQLRVQSIPTVFAFVDGQPVDAFQGALPNSEIDTFVDKIAAMNTEDGGLAEAVEAAEEMLTAGAAEDAAQTFEAILGEEPENPAAYGGLIKAHLALEDTAKAQELIDAVPPKLANDQTIVGLKAQLELAASAAEAGETAELRAKLAKDENDHQARFDLALALVLDGDAQGAIDELLDLFRRDRDWNDGAAKTQLFKVFDSLGPVDPIAKTGRRKLSSMIFL